MPKYRKKPVVIEAVKYNGFVSFPELKQFFGEETFNKEIMFRPTSENLIIPTLEGNMEARINDYIIKGINGEFYPCKPDIFEKTYEVAE
jgi:hypothetical protein